MPGMGPWRVQKGAMITPLVCRLWPIGGPKGAQTKIGPKPWIHHLGVADSIRHLLGYPILGTPSEPSASHPFRVVQRVCCSPLLHTGGMGVEAWL